MQKRTLKVALLAVLAIVLVLGISTAALAAASWSDLPDTVTAKYGVTDNQIAAISEGFDGGLWKPYQPVTRAQFTKMAVAAFNIPLATPATASFADVPVGSYYFPYVEGAKAAGIINGTTTTTFSLNANITRQQALAIVARYVAKGAGYDLAKLYTADQLDVLLKHFGDAAKISADLKAEMAFAFDMGLTQGNDFGNLDPLANLTRIQGAALLIRAQSLVPPVHFTPAKIELVSQDKTEGLIGQTYSATFEVTDAAGHPAIGVLVDFDTQYVSDYYVGNISPEAAVTNNYGQVTVNMLSLEPGTQRVSATVAGVGTKYITRYWLALDEVYTTSKSLKAQNNAGVEHQWCVRVVVFGPGPRSTSASDWYNAINTATFDPTNINVTDGVDLGDGWDYQMELDMAANATPNGMAEHWTWDKGKSFPTLAPRVLAGVNVEWTIYNAPDDPKTSKIDESITSVGDIISVDGAAITKAKTAVGKTDANGLSCIKVYSEVVGKTLTKAVADYPENPYPEQLLNHDTFNDAGYWDHDVDWDDQPVSVAMQAKTWIAHTIGGDAGPITPAYTQANVGEEKTLTILLKDVYGNPVAGKEVKWFMQGVGFFQTDDKNDISDQNGPNSKDYDTTNSAGKATVFVKSYQPGEQIVHAKVRDKGTGGNEGIFITYTAEVQWFDIDVVTFDNITTTCETYVKHAATKAGEVDEMGTRPVNEAVSSNPVGGTHCFNLWVYGLKLELDPTLSDPAHQTPYIDSDATGAAYDGIFNGLDAAYFGGLLLVNVEDVHMKGIHYSHSEADFVADQKKYDKEACVLVDCGGKILKSWHAPTVVVAGRTITLDLVGGYTMFDVDRDGDLEPFLGQTGIYMPLEGKTVIFSKVNSLLDNDDNLIPPSLELTQASVGSITEPTTPVKTDASGMAKVCVTSNVKGPETIQAVVTYVNDPNTIPAIAYAKKQWVAGQTAAADNLKFVIKINGKDVVPGCNAVPAYVKGPTALKVPYAFESTGVDGDDVSSDRLTQSPWNKAGYYLGQANIEVHVQDQYGNDLPDYEVVYLLNSIGQELDKNTFLPLAYLLDYDTTNTIKGVDYDTNGERPDSNEPQPSSDPYAYIVGPGYTGPGPQGWAHRAFFFNQWLGTTAENSHYPNATLGEGQPGVPQFPNRAHGSDIDEYNVSALLQWYSTVSVLGSPYDDWNLGAFAGLLGRVRLATDGAKAWTLDGWYMKMGERDGAAVDAFATIDADHHRCGQVAPNLLTGSNIDVQLAQMLPNGYPTDESILRIMIYKPGDGVIQEGEYLYSTQVHICWEEPRAKSIDLTPVADVDPDQEHQVVARVLDQFGNPLPYQKVYLWFKVTEDNAGGYLTALWTPDGNDTTDSSGVVSFVLTTSADFANVDIVVSTCDSGMPYLAGCVTSNVVNKYWAKEVFMTMPDRTHLWIPAGISSKLGGRSLNVYVDNGLTGQLLATGYTYDNGAGTLVTLSREINDVEDEFIFVNFVGDSLTNGAPNWVYWVIGRSAP